MSVIDGLKLCGKCHANKPTGDFYASSTSKDGWQGYCRLCSKASRKRSYYENHEKQKAYLRNRRRDNPEKWRQYDLEYYEVNHEKKLKDGVDFRARHRERLCEEGRRYKANNPDVVRACEQRRAARIKAATIYPFTQGQLRCRWEYYGNKCWICRDTATENDHVKPLAKGGAHMLGNIRPICRTCNAKKSAKWPHPKELHSYVRMLRRRQESRLSS